MDGRLLSVDTPQGLQRRALGGEVIHLKCATYRSQEQINNMLQQPFAKNAKVRNLPDHILELIVDDAGTTLPRLLEYCQQENISIISAEEFLPGFDDIFVRLIEKEQDHQEEMSIA
jgi:ABC-2 type transport system ATP-binding protein